MKRTCAFLVHLPTLWNDAMTHGPGCILFHDVTPLLVEALAAMGLALCAAISNPSEPQGRDRILPKEQCKDEKGCIRIQLLFLDCHLGFEER